MKFKKPVKSVIIGDGMGIAAGGTGTASASVNGYLAELSQHGIAL